MARTRKDFNTELVDFLGTGNVYYNPPESVKISYPCIIYKPSRPSGVNANNKRYFNMKCYEVTMISRDPEWGLPDQMMEHFSFCDLGVPFTTDNLWHWPFTIYY